MAENIFTGRNATCYDELDQSMFADSVLIPVVDFLEDLAGSHGANSRHEVSAEMEHMESRRIYFSVCIAHIGVAKGD